jgi:hypothetical protein
VFVPGTSDKNGFEDVPFSNAVQDLKSVGQCFGCSKPLSEWFKPSTRDCLFDHVLNSHLLLDAFSFRLDVSQSCWYAHVCLSFHNKILLSQQNLGHILPHEELKLRTATQVLEAKFFYLSPTPGMSPGSAY